VAAKKAGTTPVEAITHGDKRVNIPTADAQEWLDPDSRTPIPLLYPRDPTLDPQLVWKGKDAQDAEDLIVDALPLYIQEKLDPRVLIENLRRTAARPDEEPELALFDTFDGLEGLQSVEFYKHAANWSNRLILGDSLQVMGSLAEREQLRGQVQMIYLDPPYGIKFGSNWQASTRKRDVKDGKLDDATREVEQIKAFRDTWELGIHSYLAYLRDRLVVARDLLTESGSIFVQIGDENVHLARALMDEVFGSENRISQIAVRKTHGAGSPSGGTDVLAGVFDYLLWFARDLKAVKYRQLFLPRVGLDWVNYDWVVDGEAPARKLTADERMGGKSLPPEARVFRRSPLTSASSPDSARFPVDYKGVTYSPGRGGWKTNREGMDALARARRLDAYGKTLAFRRFIDDFPHFPLTNLWTDTARGGYGEDQIYVVQTGTKVIQRCMLMATDPGDLVLDPTCGSGTTAYVAEQWGRRWITMDTSRVALTLARQRIMGAKYPHYLLADSPEGRKQEERLIRHPLPHAETGNDIRKGFVYKRVPHVTLKSIANNPDIVDGMSREQIDAAIARHADTELLYDQPYEDKSVVRVAGPFTVESLSPHRAFDDEADLPASQSGADEDSTTAFEQMLLDNLRKAGVQNGRKAERFEFDEVERLPGKYLTARAVPRGDLAEQRVAVSIGPRYGTVGSDWIKAAAREAMRGQGHDVLLVLGFAFDPRALEIVEEFAAGDEEFAVQAEHQAGSIRILLVRMNVDLAMGETLLKKTKAANLFTVFGEPDVSAPQWTDEGWVITIRGFDVYNPVTGEVRAGTEDDIAMWMIDTEYEQESFFVRHAYFLGTDPYDRLKRALKAEIDPEAWESLNSATSRAFPHPSTGKVAVKVINHYGDELLTVLDLQEPEVL
jgi:adenine-specific DNA-methyltransferase